MDDIERGSMIKYLIGSNQIKYSVLGDLFKPLDLSSHKMVVMLVDAHLIMNKLHVKDKTALLADSKAETVRDIVVGFLNALGHYRRFMSTRLGKDNDIYVMFNTKAPKYNRSCIPDFRGNLENLYDLDDRNYGMMNESIAMAYEFIRGLSPYFEGIYCIDCSGVDEFALMERMGFPEDVYYVVLTKNRYAYQLIRKNVSVLRPKRDESFLLTEKNFYNAGILRDVKHKTDHTITADMLPLFWTLVGLRDVTVEGTDFVSNIGQMTRLAEKMIDRGDLVPGMSIQSFLENFRGYVHPKKLMEYRTSMAELELRHRALSTQLAAKAITSDQMAKVVAQCYDLYDETALENLNQTLAESSLNPETLALDNLNMSFGASID